MRIIRIRYAEQGPFLQVGRRQGDLTNEVSGDLQLL